MRYVIVVIGSLLGLSHSASAANYWYYCDASKAYYPYVSTCPVPWREVAPTPSDLHAPTLAAQLTTSEIDLVKQQIEQCWNVPAGARDAPDLQPKFRVKMNPDGTVRSASLLNPERLSDPFFKAAADSANRALLNPRCQPLKLSPDKYYQWQTFTITFDPRDIT